jgi:hypothetical protein
MITKFPQAPYFDDFDETKNYVRILFRPGYAVQVRELNQLQTALQAQIQRHGSFNFTQGERVYGSEVIVDKTYMYVKVQSSTSLTGTAYDLSDYLAQTNGRYDLIGKKFVGTEDGLSEEVTTNIRGVIVDIVPPVLNELSEVIDPLTVIVKITSSGGAVNSDNAGLVQTISPNEHFITLNDDEERDDSSIAFQALPTADVEGDTVYPTGFATVAHIPEAVYFVNGNFIHAPQTSITVSKYSVVPYRRVVYEIEENIITVADDATLADNALGTPNRGAPGAHRYQIVLNPAIKPFRAEDAEDSTNTIILAIIENGVKKNIASNAQSELNARLAARTKEESGNYVLNPFEINIKEYLSTYSLAEIDILHEAQYLEGETALEFGEKRLAVTIGSVGNSSVAYIDGYRIELPSIEHVPLEKARDYATTVGSAIAGAVGNFIRIDAATVKGRWPDITSLEEVEIWTDQESPTQKIGSMRVRNIVFDTTGPEDTYRIYFFNAKFDSPYTEQNARRLAIPDLFEADIIDGDNDSENGFNFIVEEASNNSLIFPLPYSMNRTVRDVSYTIKHVDTLVFTLGQDEKQVVLPVGQNFTSVDPMDYPSCLVGSSALLDETSIFFPTSVSYTVPNDKTGVTLEYTSLPGAAPHNVRFITDVEKFSSGDSLISGDLKTKRVVAGSTIWTEAVTSESGIILDEVDVIASSAATPISVFMSADFNTVPTTADQNISTRFRLDNGQRENFYDFGRLELLSGQTPPTGQVLVTYSYYEHVGSGDFFTVESYTSDENAFWYRDIPSFASIKGPVSLRDVIDFRPSVKTINSAGGFEDVRPIGADARIRASYSHYLSRIDKVYIDSRGRLGINKGVPAISPQQPADAANALVLYTIVLNPYTLTAKSLRLIPHDNQRYTMRDIGNIDKRLKNVEYYTALSLLEREIDGLQIVDDQGNPVIKNGFAADGFTDHNVAATNHADFKTSIDNFEGVLRPQFFEDNARLVLSTGESSGIKRTGPLVTLDYTTVQYISSTAASYAQPLNEFNFSSYTGVLALSPNTDEWKETSVVPNVVIDNGAYTALTNSLSHPSLRIGHVWNEWSTHWRGRNLSDEVLSSLTTASSTVEVALAAITNPGNTASAAAFNSDTGVYWNFVPYVRSRKIYFRAAGLKPNTRFYIFFGGMAINPYARMETSFVNYELDDRSSKSNKLEAADNYIGATVHPDGSTNLLSDDKGQLVGSFIIPLNNTLAFGAGRIPVTIIDNAANNKTSSTSYAETVYDVRGYRVTDPTTRNYVSVNSYNVASASAPVLVPPAGNTDQTNPTPQETGGVVVVIPTQPEPTTPPTSGPTPTDPTNNVPPVVVVDPPAGVPYIQGGVQLIVDSTILPVLVDTEWAYDQFMG